MNCDGFCVGMYVVLECFERFDGRPFKWISIQIKSRAMTRTNQFPVFKFLNPATQMCAIRRKNQWIIFIYDNAVIMKKDFSVIVKWNTDGFFPGIFLLEMDHRTPQSKAGGSDGNTQRFNKKSPWVFVVLQCHNFLTKLSIIIMMAKLSFIR